MAAKKGTVNNSDFLKKLNQATKEDLQAVDDSQSKKYQDFVQNIDKQNEYIDIDLMDDAPADWNDFPRLKEEQPDMYLKMKMSIYNVGVIQELLLLRRQTGRYMVIAGHNRRDICREIIDECKDNSDFNIQKYKYLSCKIYDEEELNEQQIRDLIDETNCMQRDISKMNPRVKANLLQRQMKNMEKRRYAKGERIDQLAKDMGLKKTAIYDTLAIMEKVIEPLRGLYFDNKISKKAVLRFTLFDKMTQQWMWDTFGEKMTDQQIQSLKKSMDRDEIEEHFSADNIKRKRISVEVPEERSKAIKELVKIYMTIPAEQEQEVLELLKDFSQNHIR